VRREVVQDIVDEQVVVVKKVDETVEEADAPGRV